MRRLTTVGIKVIAKPGRYSDGAGLHLHIRDAKRRNWVLRFMLGKRSRNMGLGVFPEVSLAAARVAAEAARALIRAGQDSGIARQQAAVPVALERERTFKAAAEKLIQVSADAVMRVLRPSWDETLETASRFCGRIEAVLDAAAARGWRYGDNPARWKGNLAARLPAPRQVRATAHHPSLRWRLLPAFLTALRLRDGMAARSIEFGILTAARSGEVRGPV